MEVRESSLLFSSKVLVFGLRNPFVCPLRSEERRSWKEYQRLRVLTNYKTPLGRDTCVSHGVLKRCSSRVKKDGKDRVEVSESLFFFFFSVFLGLSVLPTHG